MARKFKKSNNESKYIATGSMHRMMRDVAGNKYRVSKNVSTALAQLLEMMAKYLISYSTLAAVIKPAYRSATIMIKHLRKGIEKSKETIAPTLIEYANEVIGKPSNVDVRRASGRGRSLRGRYTRGRSSRRRSSRGRSSRGRSSRGRSSRGRSSRGRYSRRMRR